MSDLHRGKLATNPAIVEIRPLTREDLACLRDVRPPTNVVKAFRDWHHRIARLVAMGLKPSDIQLQCGISAARYSQYKSDPAFQELVAQYRAKVEDAFTDTAAELYATVSANTLNAEVLIRETLEEAMAGDTERPSLKTLLAISRDGADRVGLPKQKVSTNTNFNVDFASMLEKAAARSGRSNVIDGVSSRSPSRPQATSPSLAPALSVADPLPAGASGAGLIRRRA